MLLRAVPICYLLPLLLSSCVGPREHAEQPAEPRTEEPWEEPMNWPAEPMDPEPTEPHPMEPQPADPQPVEPEPVEPVLMDPDPMEPEEELTGGPTPGPRDEPPDEPSEDPAEAQPQLTESAQRLADATQVFGPLLLREVHARADGPNVFVSPLSVSRAFALALNGARGETFDAIRAGLSLPEDSLEELNASYRALLQRLRELDPAVELDLASGLFPRQDLELRAEYLTRVRDAFEAEVRPLDFFDPEAPDVINAWAHEQTRGRIEHVVDELEDDEVLFLVDAIYFQGAWTDAFDPEQAIDAPFMRADGTMVEVPMMNRRAEETRYLRDEARRIEAIELPYGDGAFTFIALLPPPNVPLADFVAELDAETWDGLMSGFEPSRVALALPRLRLELATSLVEPLTALGMGIAFEAGRADLLNLAELPPGVDLYVTRADHHTFLEVDERGTTAAAVTTIGIGVVSAPPTFRADRPYLIAIREASTGTLLFLGAIGDPSAG